MIKGMLPKTLILCLLIIFFFFGAFIAKAQVRSTDIVLSISPKYPAPNQNVEAKLSTQVASLDKAYISWSVNGNSLSGGIGKTNFAFDTGTLGTTIQVSASIELADGTSVEKSIYIDPFEVDMLWEAVDSYAPPFYRGKTLVSKEGMFKVVAMPSSLASNTSSVNFSYAWKKDNRAQLDSSGWGKRYYIFKNPYIDRTNTINAQISDINGKIISAKSLVIYPFNPKIIFYRVDPMYGIQYETALTDGFQIKEEGGIIAGIPYYINSKNLNSSEIIFNWKIDEEDIYTTTPNQLISLIPEKNKRGTSQVSLNVENDNNLFNGITKLLRVNF